MTTEWVLIIGLFSPGGDFIAKQNIVLPSKAICQQAKKDVEKPIEGSLPMKVKGLCVTMAHWEGKSQDKGVAFD
jgi:hypothetical protein